MTGEAYDHMMAAVVLAAIFVASVVVVPSLSYVNLLYLDQQQLQNIALSAMKTILFDEGYPTNWGSMHGTNMFNETDVKRFGLAAQSDPSLYVLDPNKVYRLAYNPMGNISFQRAQELLGLQGYGFSLVFRPLFNVSRNVNIETPNDSTATVTFSANVSRFDGQPVPNAIVRATIIYAADTSTGFLTGTSEIFTTTDSLGRSGGSKTISLDGNSKIRDVLVIFRITVAGRATMVVSSQDTRTPGDIAKINVVGNNIILTIPDSVPGSNDARWITNIMMYNFETSVSLLNGTGTGQDNKLNYGSDILWSQAFNGLDESEPGILVVTFRTETLGPGGRTLAVLIGPYGLWGQSGVMQFNNVPVSSGASACIQRDVIIAGMAYVAELRLWKT
jgi:hypothetical protein